MKLSKKETARKNQLEACREYKSSIDVLVDEFVRKYFTYDDGSVAEYYIIGDKTLPHLAPNVFCINDRLYYTMDEAYEALYSDLPKDRVLDRAENPAFRPNDLNFYNYCMFGGNPPIEYTEEERQKDLKNIRNTYKSLLECCGVEKTKEEIDEFMKQIEK